MSVSAEDLYRGCAVVRIDKCEMLGRTWEAGWYAFGAPIPIPLHDKPFSSERECKDFVRALMQQP